MDQDDRFATDPDGAGAPPPASAGLILAARYKLDALLADSRGIMTWRATDLVLSRPVLIHLLGPEDERLGWVLQAARRAATVPDSRFLRVLDALEASGQEPWSLVVCEYAVGDSLRTLLADGPLESTEAAYIVHELAAALAPLHARGLFHLRLGPDAVIITSNGNVKIAGFLIEAALRPQPDEQSLSWSEQEAIDLRALGAVLYAATTGRWPVPANEPQRPVAGLPPAPLRDSRSVSDPVWPAPHQLNRAVDPELSAVTMAALRPSSGVVGPALHSADQVADSLDTLAGTLEAEESLERLVRERAGLARNSPTPGVRPTDDGWHLTQPAEHDLPTRPMPAIRGVPPEPAGVLESDRPTVAGPAIRSGSDTPYDQELADGGQPVDPHHRFERTGDHATADPQPGPEAAISAPPARPRPVPAPPRQPRPGRSVLGRRWVLLLVGFVLIALLALQLRGCLGEPDQVPVAPSDTSQSSAPAGPQPAAIVAAFDFDPQADGGDANENSDQAAAAADGDPSTVWHTLTYLNNPKFGGLKPGAGIVFDLGAAVPVESLSLIMANQPTALQLMVPIESDPTAARPPMNSVSEWRVIAEDPAAGLEVTLRPAEPVEARWVMVYFTNLPPVGASLYRSGIAEAYVNR